MGAGRATVPGAAAPTGAPASMTTRWLGRPLPKFLEATGMNNGLPQDGNAPGGMNGFNPAGRNGRGANAPPKPESPPS
jgi:hypothetical protein